VEVFIRVTKRNFGPKGRGKVLEFMEEIQEKKMKSEI
jgi:RNA 3'-terminal phosphate cyclase